MKDLAFASKNTSKWQCPVVTVKGGIVTEEQGLRRDGLHPVQKCKLTVFAADWRIPGAELALAQQNIPAPSPQSRAPSHAGSAGTEGDSGPSRWHFSRGFPGHGHPQTGFQPELPTESRS